MENEIAYFDNIDTFELSQNNIFDIYDQWLLFDYKVRFENMESFVIYSGFSVDLNMSKNRIGLIDTKRFWNQIDQIKPQKFIINGDKLIFGTNSSLEFTKVKLSYEQSLLL